MNKGDRRTGRAARALRGPGFVVALLIPFAALALQWFLWAYITPFVWFFFFPAVFFSARMGGFVAGLIATTESALIVIFFFIAPRLSWQVENPSNLLSVAVFLVMGYLFSNLQESLARAMRATKAALEESRAADELKTRFFANVSHELRTPLTLVLGTLLRVKNDPGTGAAARRDLSIAERNARHVFRHVSDLLDLAKLEAAEMSLDYETSDAAAIMRTTASYFAAEAAERGMALELDVPATLPMEVDAEKLRRIVNNLLSNALKFAGKGGRVRLGLRAEAGMAVLAVEDDGPGVPEGMREAVFERFRQVEDYGTRRHGGTGLGLSIVKAFAELHGGRAAVSSSAAGGALFTVTLPLAAPPGSLVRSAARPGRDGEEIALEAVATLKEERRGGGAGRVYGQGDAALILVVEDNADMNDFIASSLEGSYRVAQAFDGRQGVAKALALGPEAIVTDVMMPDLGGEDLIRELRSHRDLDAVPIIVLSALVDDALRVRLLREGAQDYLGKPFSEAELHARIERLLAERRRSAEALKEAEDRYRLVAENAVDVIWILDPAVWRFRFVSPSVERLRGWTAEEVLGQELEAALVPASAARLKAAMPGRITAFLDGGASTYVDEIEQPRKGGGTVWTETTTRFVPGAKTGAVEIYGISRDISERRQAEARMRRDLAEREALIRELYHRTRNNMSVISSMLDLQALRMEDEAATASFEAIARKIDAMALAHRMLYGAGDLSHVKLDDYIRELAGLFLAHAPLEAERIDLVLELAPASCLLDLAIPFGQVLSELILNSLRHAFPDGREGRISLGLSSLPDGRLDFRYADDGVGLPQGFDPRLAGGLGLETLFMLVEHQLQGSVEVETRGGLFWRIVFGGTAYKVRV